VDLIQKLNKEDYKTRKSHEKSRVADEFQRKKRERSEVIDRKLQEFSIVVAGLSTASWIRIEDETGLVESEPVDQSAIKSIFFMKLKKSIDHLSINQSIISRSWLELKVRNSIKKCVK